ncbi:MAG: tetratricopeptide repeat protein [Planctomycetota bacterium]|jgi:tetratricopeptide (TPR) repeat protein
MLRKTTVAVIIVALVFCVGCQSHAQNKKAAKERWERASAQVKLALAQQQYDDGKYAEAAETVRQCIGADPQIPQAHLLLGKLLLAEDRREDAIGELLLAVELDKGLDEGWYWLGVAAQENKEYEEAYELYGQAMSLEPTNVDYILAVADVQAARNNCSQALELLTEAIAARPRDVSLKVAAADVMLRTGSNEGAIKLYKQAMLMTGDNSDIAEALGYCYVFSGKWSEAAEIFSGLVEQCRDAQKKKLYLQVAALSSMNCGQYDRAVSCYSKLSVEERDNAEIWMKMGQGALGAGTTGRALTCGQKALALRPGYADAIALIGCAQYAAGDYAAAAESFKKIAADKKNKGFSLLMRARCYEQLGQINEAEQAYKKALEMNPHSELGAFLAKGKDIKHWRSKVEEELELLF